MQFFYNTLRSPEEIYTGIQARHEREDTSVECSQCSQRILGPYCVFRNYDAESNASSVIYLDLDCFDTRISPNIHENGRWRMGLSDYRVEQLLRKVNMTPQFLPVFSASEDDWLSGINPADCQLTNSRHLIGLVCSSGFLDGPDIAILTRACKDWLLEIRSNVNWASLYEIHFPMESFIPPTLETFFNRWIRSCFGCLKLSSSSTFCSILGKLLCNECRSSPAYRMVSSETCLRQYNVTARELELGGIKGIQRPDICPQQTMYYCYHIQFFHERRARERQLLRKRKSEADFVLGVRATTCSSFLLCQESQRNIRRKVSAKSEPSVRPFFPEMGNDDMD